MSAMGNLFTKLNVDYGIQKELIEQLSHQQQVRLNSLINSSPERIAIIRANEGVVVELSVEGKGQSIDPLGNVTEILLG